MVRLNHIVFALPLIVFSSTPFVCADSPAIAILKGKGSRGPDATS